MKDVASLVFAASALEGFFLFFIDDLAADFGLAELTLRGGLLTRDGLPTLARFAAGTSSLLLKVSLSPGRPLTWSFFLVSLVEASSGDFCDCGEHEQHSGAGERTAAQMLSPHHQAGRAKLDHWAQA